LLVFEKSVALNRVEILGLFFVLNRVRVSDPQVPPPPPRSSLRGPRDEKMNINFQ